MHMDRLTPYCFPGILFRAIENASRTERIPLGSLIDSRENSDKGEGYE